MNDNSLIKDDSIDIINNLDSNSSSNSNNPNTLDNYQNYPLIQSHPRRPKKCVLFRKSILELILYTMIIFILAVILYLSILFFSTDIVETIAFNHNIPKAYNDSRIYSIIQLRNDIKVALISDINTTNSALSFTLGTGGFHDDTIPGLNHLTARLMLLRSPKFNKTYLTNFLAKDFGKFSMEFRDEETAFNFEIGIDGFPTALNIFGEMMTYPKFNAEIVEFEKRVLETKYKYSLRNQTVNERQILNELVFKDKMYFPNGNTESFNGYTDEQLAEEAMKVYERYYYGGNVNIAVISSHSIKELKGMVIKAFKDIKRYPIKTTTTTTTNDKDNEGHIPIKRQDLKLGQFITFSHLSDITLNYHFFFDKHSTSKPNKTNKTNDELLLHYLTTIIKDRSDHSLFKLFDKENIASLLSSQYELIDKNLIHITIKLGVSLSIWNSLNKINEILFNFLRLVRDNIPKEDLYTELNMISMQSFHFEPFQSNYISYVNQLSHYMNTYDNITNVFYGNYYHPPYDKEALVYYLSQLIPENCAIVFTTSFSLDKNDLANVITDPKAYESNWKYERWYKLKFTYDALSSKAIKRYTDVKDYDSQLEIRGLNPFISKETQCVLPNWNDDYEMKNRTPSKVIDVSHAKMWYKLDRTFYSPKSIVHLHLITPYIRTIDFTLYYVIRMYFEYIQYSIDRDLYQFKDSGNTINLSENENGIVIEIIAYSDLLHDIMAKISNIFYNPSVDIDLLHTIFSLVSQSSQADLYSNPYELSQEYLTVLLKKHVLYFHNIYYPIQIKEFYNIINMSKDFHITALFYGNINQEEASSIFTDLFISKLNPKSLLIEKHLVIFSEKEIKETLYCHHSLSGSFIIRLRHHNIEYTDQTVCNYFYVSQYNKETDIIATLMVLLWEKAFQNAVYDKIQGVSSVSSKKVIIDNRIYLNFIVQALEDPIVINTQMDKVIEAELLKRLKMTTEDGLYYAKEVFIRRENAKDASMYSKAKDIFDRIYMESSEFEKRDYDRDMLKTYTLEEIIGMFKRVFYSEVGKLSVQLFNPNSGDFVIKNEPYVLNTSLTSIVTENVNYFDKK